MFTRHKSVCQDRYLSVYIIFERKNVAENLSDTNSFKKIQPKDLAQDTRPIRHIIARPSQNHPDYHGVDQINYLAAELRGTNP